MNNLLTEIFAVVVSWKARVSACGVIKSRIRIKRCGTRLSVVEVAATENEKPVYRNRESVNYRLFAWKNGVPFSIEL